MKRPKKEKVVLLQILSLSLQGSFAAGKYQYIQIGLIFHAILLHEMYSLKSKIGDCSVLYMHSVILTLVLVVAIDWRGRWTMLKRKTKFHLTRLMYVAC